MKALIKLIKMIREERKLGNSPYWTFYNTLLNREFNRNPISGDAAIINGHPELSLNADLPHIRDI